MDIILSDKAKKEIVKYAKYLENTLNFSEGKIDELVTEFENRLRSNIEKQSEHIPSIFPMKSKYGKGYKMYVDVQKHRVIFYKEDKDENDNDIIRIHECPHSSELIKYLNKKKIKPVDDADPELLLDFLTVEKEDKVNNETITDEERDEYNRRKEELEDLISIKKKKQKEESQKNPSRDIDLKSSEKDSDEEFEEDTDEEGNPRQHKTGPQGGKYYRVKKNGKWGPWNSESNESLKDIRTLITESNIVSLSSYITERLSS